MARTPEPRLDKEALFEDLGYVPHEGQRLVHQSTAPRRVLACGVRWGKSRCAAMEAIAAALEPRERSMGWVCAPTYDLADKVFREIVVIAAEHLRHRILVMRESEKRLVLRNLAGSVSELRGKSADNPVSLLGEGLDYLIVDEASRLKPTIWEGHLSQRLVDKRGWALLISTPKGKGWFYDAFRRGQGRDPDYESWNAPSWQNPHLPADMIERERDRLPERVFRQEYGGAFCEGEGVVFPDVSSCARGGWAAPVPGRLYFAGLDLARIQDFTVMIVLDEFGQVAAAGRCRRVDWQKQVRLITELARRYNQAKILLDSTGVGDPIHEALRAAGNAAVPYQFTNRSKAALIDGLALALEKGELVLPRRDLFPVMLDELESFEYQVSESGNVKTSAPPGSHDDCVIALALATWNLKHNLRAVRFRTLARARPRPRLSRAGGMPFAALWG